jgi:coenzyme F420-dependent glucose-6-phosphate dehydrogenase
MLGALGEATERVHVGVGVTCPPCASILRSSPRRPRLRPCCSTAASSGAWGPAKRSTSTSPENDGPVPRSASRCWKGGRPDPGTLEGDTVDHRGRYYEVENARVFDAPRSAIPSSAPDKELLGAFEQAGGDGPRYAQLTVCWADEEETAKKTVHDIWPNPGLSGQLSQDLPTWTHFEQAAEPLTPDQVTASLPWGPDIVDEIVESAREYVEAGYDHLYFHQVGPDQDGFFEFWQRQLQHELTALRIDS